MRLIIPVRIERGFVRAAKKAFPREEIAYVVGHLSEDTATVEDLLIPPQSALIRRRDSISVCDVWLTEAHESMEEDGLEMLGDIHSHTYVLKEYADLEPDCAPSEYDLDTQWGIVHGICGIMASRSRLKGRIRWWGNLRTLEICRTMQPKR